MRYSVVCIGLMGLLGLRQVDTEITIYTTGELLLLYIYTPVSSLSRSILLCPVSQPLPFASKIPRSEAASSLQGKESSASPLCCVFAG